MVLVPTGRAVIVTSTLQIFQCARGATIYLAARLSKVGATGETDHIGSQAAGV